MNILMTGATGLIGKEIGKLLVSQGHELTVLTRNTNEAQSSLPFPARLVEWKHYNNPLSPEVFNEIDSVIHLAGESIASGRWSNKRKKEILESRQLGTRNLVNAIMASSGRVKQFISASAIGIYGDTQNEVDENSSQANDFLAKVCVAWEDEAKKLKQKSVKVINPRIGIVLSRHGGAMEKMLPLFSLGIGGVIGSGKQWMSWIHIEDLAQMFVHFVNNPNLEGAYNAVAPEPATNKVFSKTLAKALGKNLFIPVPSIALKIGLGEMSKLVTGGQKVSSKKIQGTNFQFKFASLVSALNEICSPLTKGQKEALYEIWLPNKVSEIFPFFSDEKNLEVLTPKHLKFQVLKKSTPDMQKGTLIDYRLNLYGIPLKWRTLIESWQVNKQFTDEQLKGPYKKWHHTHEFIEFAGGTLMRDRVHYKMPFGLLGEAITGPLVKSDVNKIFSYRRRVIAKIFTSK
ncbi:MAG: TIGR01777 family oxidoreductase [Bacteriovoracaceae bacterium]|nr:TIGR01777 family oxidoreductase [Bacteriovoracaceae bacterium]